MIKIITDSASDISLSEAKEFGIEIVPMTVTFAGESFKDSVDLTVEEFYAKLSSVKELPVTSQINPKQFEEVFEKYRNDDIICILISSKLSGTIQSALIAKNNLGRENIHIVDSDSATFAEGLLVREAVKLAKKENDAKEIVRKLNEIAPRIKLYAVVDTLKYLQYGGRISMASATVGRMLNILPVISLENGVVAAAAKVRGKKLGYKWIIDKIKVDGIDENYPVAFGNASSPVAMESFIDMVKNNLELDDKKIARSALGATIGTHAGPGAIGIAFVAKK